MTSIGLRKLLTKATCCDYIDYI